MSKKSLSLILLLFLLFSGFAPMASAHNAPFPPTYDPTHLVEDTISEPESLDPAWAYDTRSCEVILQVYEPLIFFAVNYTQGPYKAGQVNQFVSKLATDLTIQDNFPPWMRRYTFRIRGLSGTHVLERALGIPPGNPVATDWHEINPWTSTNWRLEEWRDVDVSGKLSIGDILKLSRDCQNTIPVYWRVYQYFVVDAIDPVNKRIAVTEERVKFHDNVHTLSTSDVEYSFERALVQDRDGGPMWMLYKPLLDVYGAVDPTTDPLFGQKIDNAVGSNSTHVWLNLAMDYPEWETLLQILSQTWSSIVNKEWAVAMGDFDGDWTHTWQYIWDHWHNQSFIGGNMMGTGPYKFDYWFHGVSWSLVKFDAYWGGWPAQVEWPTHPTPPPGGESRYGGFISRVTWYFIPSWTTRRARFLAGDSDKTYVPRQYTDQVLGQIVGGEPIRCYCPLSLLALEALFFTFNINPESPYLGRGFDPNDPYRILEDRIPINLFSDVNVRKGFAYAFNYDLWLASVYLGEGERPATPVKEEMKYHNPAAARYYGDLALAEYYLRQAWIDHPDDDPGTPEGALWDNGMEFTIVYDSGNIGRETAAAILRDSINSLSPKFHIQTWGVDWTMYLGQMKASMLPLFFMCWNADFTDPHNSVYAFMHSQGIFASIQKFVFKSRLVDDLIEAGIKLPDDTRRYNGELDYWDPRPYFDNYPNIPPDTRWPRRSIYYWLQWLYYDYAASIPLIQPVGRHWEQAWVRGWYFNPLYGGSLAPAIDSTAPEAPVQYVYHLWKAATHFGDANNDGAVGLLDAATISTHWPFGPLRYNPKADINGGTGCIPGGGTGTVRGMPDGRVDILDAALVSAYWDGPPQGPSHP